MKYLFLICFPLPICAFSQKSYFHVYGGYSPARTEGNFLAGLSAGGKLSKSLGLGAGVSYMKFDKAYIPITADLTVLEPGKKVKPICGVKAGYGIYNKKYARGGFTGSLFAGVSVPVTDFTTSFMLGVTHYSFSSTYPVESNEGQNRVTVTMGVLL